HPELAAQAEKTLERLGYRNVSIRVGDGSQGWTERAPFDAILVSAAAMAILRLLLDQLGDGGRMMLPVGPPEVQQLQLVRKETGQVTRQALEGCRFVPLIQGEYIYRAYSGNSG